MKELSPAEIRQMKAAARSLMINVRPAAPPRVWFPGPPMHPLAAFYIGAYIGMAIPLPRREFAMQTLPLGWVLDRQCLAQPSNYGSHSTSCLATSPGCLTGTIVPASINQTSLAAVARANPNSRVAVAYNAPPGTHNRAVAAVWRRGCATPVPDRPWPVEAPIRRKQRERLPLLPPLAPALDPNAQRAIPRRFQPGVGTAIDPIADRQAEDEYLRANAPPERWRVILAAPAPGLPAPGRPAPGRPTPLNPPRFEVQRPAPGSPRPARPAVPKPINQVPPGTIAPARPPAHGTAERKGSTRKPVADAIYTGLDKLSEACDAIDSIHDALPDELQVPKPAPGSLEAKLRKVGGQYAVGQCEQQLAQVIRHYDKLDLAKVAENLIYNEIEDKVIGRTNAAIQKAIGHQNAQKLTRILNQVGANPAQGIAINMNRAYQSARRKASDAWRRYS